MRWPCVMPSGDSTDKQKSSLRDGSAWWQSKRQLRLEKADSKRNVTLIASWQIPIDWLRHAGAKPRGEVDYSAARQDASSDRDCRFDQKEESSMIGRDLFNIPCMICRRPTIHRTRTRHPERKSKSEGHCGSYQAGRERRNSHIPTSTQALLPTSTHSNGFCIIRVCISSSSSSFGFAHCMARGAAFEAFTPRSYLGPRFSFCDVSS
jgi:hypothetical protein